jgi:hypothetical protein
MWVVSPADSSGNRFVVSGGEISGDGELVGTTNEFVISKNDYPLMSFTSDASGLFITNYTVSATASNATWTLYIATNGVTAAPFAEWSESLTVGAWSRVSTFATETYPTASNGTYTLEFTVPAGDVCYVRAMQPVGDSIARVETDIFIVDGVISNTAFQAAQADIETLNSNAVTSVVLNGTTNTPTAGVVDLGELVTALQDSGSVNGTNRTATLTYDFTNNWWTTTVTDD